MDIVTKEFIQGYKEYMGHTILGAFISGVGNNSLYLNDVSYTTLGESFCNFGTNKLNVLTTEFADPARFNGDPDTFSGIQELIDTTYSKLDEFVSKAEGHGFSREQIESGVKKYGQKLLKSASDLAFGEGDTSSDLKQDIRVLLKIGIDEFEKRSKEDEQMKEQETGDNTVPEEGMDGEATVEGNEGMEGAEGMDPGVEDDSMYMDNPDDGGEFQDDTGNENFEGGEPINDDENENPDDTGDDDYEALANEAFGDDNTGDDTGSEDDVNKDDDEEDDKDKAEGEYARQFFSGSIGYGESYTASAEAFNYTKMIKKGYRIPNISKEEEAYLASLANYGPGRAWEAMKRSFTILKSKFGSRAANRDATVHADQDYNFLEGFNKMSVLGYLRFLKLVEILDATIFTFRFFPGSILLLPIKIGANFIDYQIQKFVLKCVYKNNNALIKHVKTIKGIDQQMIAHLEDIKKQSIKLGDRKVTQKCTELIKKYEDEIQKIEEEWEVFNKYGESSQDLAKKLYNKNLVANYSGQMKYLVRGEVTSLSEHQLNEIVSEMLDVEEESYKAIGESNGYNFDNQDIAKHKSVLNTYKAQLSHLLSKNMSA